MYMTFKQHRFAISVMALLFTLILGGLGPMNRAVQAQSKSDFRNNSVRQIEAATPRTREIVSPNAQSVSDPQNNAVWRVEAAGPSAPLVAPVDRSWTSAGATGTVDEDSLAIAQEKNFATTFLPGATGTILVRYNITATDGTTSFCPATFAMVRMRYRNSDSTGMTAKYSWELHSSNLSTGGNTTLVTFASTISSSFSNGNAFLTVTGTLGGVDFDFANNIYWLEVKIFRSDAAQFSDIGSFQFWESAGTPCP